MINRPPPSLGKWAFVLADVILVVVCGWVIKGVLPAKSLGDSLVMIVAISGWIFGAWICIKPWLEEFKAQNKHLENETLASAVEQIQRLEEVAGRIQSATSSWQTANDAATRSATAAREIEEKIKTHMKDFMEFNERVNSDEKRHMSLEVEKLRRVEADWLQVSARMLDHTFLLNLAGQRSGQENLITQLNTFQNALRDTARRMGLVPFLPVAGERFDTRAHQTETPEVEPAEGSIISEILATGFTFQGQLLRRALVRVAAAGGGPAVESPSVTSEPAPEPAPEENNGQESKAVVDDYAKTETQAMADEKVETAMDTQPEPDVQPAATEENSVAAMTNIEEATEPAPVKPRRTRKPDLQASLPL